MARLGEEDPRERMVSTTIYVEREQMAALRRLSYLTRVPLSVYIRDGIDAVLLHELGVVVSDRAEGDEDAQAAR